MDKVEELAQQVERLRQHIVASLPNDEEALDALAHVKEAVTVLNDAAERIMTAADEIKAAVPATAPHSAAVNKAYGKLIEACSFHDLTCQRLTKIRKTLETVTDGLDKIRPFVIDIDMPPLVREPIDENAALLNGPALESEGMSQEDIDRMLEM
jgi:chemotaxis protein CheZ